MEITVAKYAGFCFGVERAVNTVYDIIKEHKGKKYIRSVFLFTTR